MASSGSASYSTNATNYGRNSADAYYYLSAPDTINGPLTVTGNLHVQGTSTLDGAVSCGSTLDVAGATTLTGAATLAGALSVAGAVSAPDGTVNVTGALGVTGNITVGSSGAAATVTAVGPLGSVQLNPAIGGFPGIGFSYGALTTLIGLQTATGPLLVGNNGVTVGILGPLSVPSLTTGSLGASTPATVANSTEYTMVVSGWRIVWGETAANSFTGAISFNFVHPFATGTIPWMLVNIAGQLVGVCSNGGANNNTSWQGTAKNIDGSGATCALAYLAIGPA